MHGWMHGWIFEGIDRWTDGWVDAWMDCSIVEMAFKGNAHPLISVQLVDGCMDA